MVCLFGRMIGHASRRKRVGRVMRRAATSLRDVMLDNVEPGTVVSTDELMSYGLLTGDG